MNYMLLAAEVSEEVVEEATAQPFTISAATLRLIILGVIVLAICGYFILKPTEERKNNAKKYLNGLATNILGIILANIDFKIDSFTGKVETNFDDFKQNIIDEIYKESWDFVDSTIKKAVADGKIDALASRYIKKESVESLVDLIVSRDDVITKFKKAYDMLSDEVIKEIMKEEEQARLAAEEAESQEEEPGDPVVEDSVEAFGSNEPNPDDSEICEPYDVNTEIMNEILEEDQDNIVE